MKGLRRFAAITSATLIALGLVGGAAPSVAIAEEYPPVALTSTSDTASWSGQFAAGASAASPGACTSELCDIVPLDVQLPEKTWQQRPGGLLVEVQSRMLEAANIDLFVYGPDGTEVASSTLLVPSEAAWVPDPVNGRYTVVVVPTLAAGQPLYGGGVSEPFVYDGFVKFQRGLTVEREELNFGKSYVRQIVAFGLSQNQPVRELLPDLVPTTPEGFQVWYGGSNVRVSTSCLPTESLGLHDDEPTPGNGPARCLRFHQGEYNFGDGPFQLNVYDVDGDFEVYQRIYSSDGTARQNGPLGEVRYSDAHGHFHYLGFQEITLHRIEQDGSLTFIKQKPDKGICMIDAWLGSVGRTDRRTSPPGYPFVEEGHCVTFSREDPNDPTYPRKPFFEMGISVGWADVYPNYLPEQYIDITDVPDGDYALVVRQDVDNRVLEKNTKNNTAIGCVRITGDVAEDIPCGTGR